MKMQKEENRENWKGQLYCKKEVKTHLLATHTGSYWS